MRVDFGRLMRAVLVLAVLAALLLHPASPFLPLRVGPLTPLHLVIAGAFALMVGHGAVHAPRCLHLHAVEIGLGAFIGAVLASYAAAIVGGHAGGSFSTIAVAGIVALGTNVLAYRLFATWIRTRAQLRSMVNLIVNLTTFNAAVNLVAWLATTGGVIARYNFVPPMVGSQGISTLLSTLGFVLALVSRRFAPTRDNRPRFALFMKLVILASSVVVIVTRQGQLTFLVALFLYLLMERPHRHHRGGRGGIAIVLAVLVVVALVIMVSGRDILTSYVQTDSNDLLGRLANASAAFDVFRDNALFGIGYGTLGAEHQLVFYVTGVPVRVASAHNGLASLAAETGIFGMATFGALAVVVMVTLQRTRRRLRAIDGALFGYASAVVVLFAVELCSMTLTNSMLVPLPSEPIYLQVGFLYWSLAGMARAALRLPPAGERDLPPVTIGRQA